MSQLSVSKPSKEDTTGFMRKLGDPRVNKGVKGTRAEKVIAIVVGQLVIWLEIQNALLEVKLVENVKQKTILPVSAKPKQRNHKSMGKKLIILSGLLTESSQTCLSCLWVG